MNKAIGVGIGIGVLVIAFAIVGGSTMFGGEVGLPFDDKNKMQIGDKVSVTIVPGDEVIEEEVTTEGKSLEINLVDGISATSTP